MAITSNEETDELLITPKTSTSSSLLLHPFQWLQTLSSTLHPTLILAITVVYGVNDGFSGSYFGVVTDYYFKDVQKINPSSAQLYVGLFYIPWILRPLWGLLTDVFPVMGYHRRPYFVVAGFIGIFSVVFVTAVGKLPVGLAVVCLTGVKSGMAVATATIDACVAKSSIEVNELAADLQSLCVFINKFGALLGFSISGFLVHFLGPQEALGILSIAPTLFLLLGFYFYERRTVNSIEGSMKVVERVRGAMDNMYGTIKLPQVWKPSLFIFLTFALSYSTHEGHFYWYTNPTAGPGFSKEFVGTMYAIGAVGSMFGVFIYNKFLKNFPFKTLLFYTQLLFGLSGMLDLMFILRWNLPLGIPDSFFIIMEEIVLHIITSIRWMPMVVLSTKLCPLGIEGTFFALLKCIDSLGSLSSKMIGGMALHLFHVSRNDFTNLWLVVLVRNCFRFGSLALIFLVPNATQSDVLVPNATSNKNRDCVKEETLELVPMTMSAKLDV